ncbi:uncharacterized protein TRIADDRAFT_18823, partial [Trichoplax adhaerens]
ESPFVNWKMSADNLEGNSRFEGFIVDLLNELSKSLKFQFTLEVVKDNSYGGFSLISQEWNGMVKDIIDEKADIAAGAFSITVKRSEVIDFTIPFMDQGVTILMTKPKTPPVSIFRCFAPFNLSLWIVIGVFLIVIAILFFVVGILSPYDSFIDAQKWKDDYGEVVASMNLGNSLWNSVSTFLQQGHDRPPTAISGRIMLGSAWLASCIIIATYTANLAAFLTVENLNSEINSLQQLASQSKVKYGTVQGSSVYNFFERATMAPYNEMAQRLINVPNTEAGINKTKNEDYAFLWDAAIIDYYKNKYCTLNTVGGQFRKDGYALGLRKGSPFTQEISIAILKLRQSGYIEHTLKKW